jgi:sugar phosphate isomerase/epimerase
VRFKERFYAQEPLVAMNCDLGHLYCVGDDPMTVVQRFRQHIAHIHLEDIGANHVHQHLPLGKGSMNIPAIARSIDGSGYAGWVTVELYPYVSTAGDVAREAMAYLRSC